MMDKNFDDLFNEFFKRNSPFGDFKTWMNDAESIFKMFGHALNDSFDESLEQEFEKNLGKPDEVRYFTQNGMYFEKSIWHTQNGDMVKTVMSDDPSVFGDNIEFEDENVSTKKKEKPLELQLEEALEREDYERAAEIRDLLNPPKRRRKGRPKNLDN
jgi:hypothetical protein